MPSDKPYTVGGLQRILNAARYSSLGLRSAFANEAAFRQELYACIVLVPLGLWLGESPIERALLVGSLLIVLIVELLNSALENVVDRIGSEHHVLAGRAKDQGSAAVMVAVVLVAVVWGMVLLT